MRDYRKIRVFADADRLVVRVYEATRSLPVEERFALQSQIRRAALSVPTNIVEGCGRETTKDYVHFLNIAMGSANETRYLIDVATRLAMMQPGTLLDEYDDLLRSLGALIKVIRSETSGQKPEASG